MEENRDLIAEWLKLGREVLEKHFPQSPHAVYVIELADGSPAVQLVVTPSSASGPSAPERKP